MAVYAVREGGLGNQLFQLAAAITADPRGDGRLLPAYGVARFDVEHLAPTLNPGTSLFERLRLGRVFDDAQQSPWQRPLHKVLGVARHRLGEVTYRHHSVGLERAFEARREVPIQPRVLIGYFQHPDWYRPSLAQVVDGLLAAAPPDLTRRLGGEPVVSVRGGDYFLLHWVLPDTYYLAAQRIAPVGSAQVVSDDNRRGTAVAQLLGTASCNAELVGGGPLDDFWRIAAAPHVVMSNSTFCWWAVQVGDELYRRCGLPRTVVAPKEWIGNGLGPALVEERWCAV